MDIINFYLKNGELKSIPYKNALKQWINSYGSKREFLKDLQNANYMQLEMGGILVIQFLQKKYNAVMPEENDPNFQDFIYDPDYFVKELKFAINDMGPVYELNPNFWNSKLGVIVQLILGVIGIGLFVGIMEAIFT